MYFEGVEIEKPPLGASERCALQCWFGLMVLHQKVFFLQCGIAIFLENTNGENQVFNVNHYVKRSLLWWFENSSLFPSLCWAGRQRRLHCCTSGSNFNKNAFNFSLFPSTLLCRKSRNLLCHSLSWNSFRKRNDPYRCRLILDNLCTYCQIINIFNMDRLCSIPRVTVS